MSEKDGTMETRKTENISYWYIINLLLNGFYIVSAVIFIWMVSVVNLKAVINAGYGAWFTAVISGFTLVILLNFLSINIYGRNSRTITYCFLKAFTISSGKIKTTYYRWMNIEEYRKTTGQEDKNWRMVPVEKPRAKPVHVLQKERKFPT